MSKNIYFNCVGVLLCFLYLVLTIRNVFLEPNKVYSAIFVYI